MLTISLIALVIILLYVVAAFSEAIMDTVDFKFSTFIFNKPDRHTKIFGMTWNIWWNQSEGWKNKYHHRDPTQGLRTVYVFNFKMPVWVVEIISDSWHFFKMIKTLSERIAASLLFVFGIMFPGIPGTIFIAISILLFTTVVRYITFEYSLKKLTK